MWLHRFCFIVLLCLLTSESTLPLAAETIQQGQAVEGGITFEKPQRFSLPGEAGTYCKGNLKGQNLTLTLLDLQGKHLPLKR